MRRAWAAGRLGAALVVAGALVAGCGGGSKNTLVVYSPHGRDLLGLFEKRFEALHPGLDVRWLDMGSQEVYDRLRSEKANPQADVWFGGPDTIFARGAGDGLLQPFRPSWAEAVPAESRGTGDRWFGVYRTPAVLAWNDKAVAAADAPRDWDDLLAPRFTGRVLIREPLASGTMRTAFGWIVARAVQQTGSPDAGFAWLARLDGQTREYVQNPALLHEKLARQEGWVTIWDLTDILIERVHGSPFAYGFPTSGTPVIDDAIGLVAGARHAEAAKQFIEWVGSPDAQLLAAKEVYRLPARTDLDPAQMPEWERDVEAHLVPAQVDWDLLAAQGPDWMRRWDREIRGKSKR